MARYDHKELITVLNGLTINDWADGDDVFSFKQNSAAGQLVIGADGRSTYIANPDNSATVTLKLKQHSKQNKLLNDLYIIQKNRLKEFTPFTLIVTDAINGDVIKADGGYLIDSIEIKRGTGNNAQQWAINFAHSSVKLQNGAD